MNAVLPGTDMGRTQIYPLLFTTLCAVALTFCSCTDEPSGPAPPSTPDTTSHEFVWEVDTLDPSIWYDVFTIWGTSKNNIYIGGMREGLHSTAARWNGASWTFLDEPKNQRKEIFAIDGVDSNYIVFMGMNQDVNPKLITYTDGVWGSIDLPQPMRLLRALKVVSRDELYIGGYDGILQHKNGNWNWLLDSTDSIINGSGEFQPTSMMYVDGHLHQFTSLRDVNNDYLWFFLFENINEHYIAVDSFFVDKGNENNMRFGLNIVQSEDGIFSASGGGVFEYTNKTWYPYLPLKSSHISGTRHNLFIVGNKPYALYHFNGSTLQRIVLPNGNLLWPERIVNRVFYIDGVVFVSVRHRNYTTCIYRGYQME